MRPTHTAQANTSSDFDVTYGSFKDFARHFLFLLQGKVLSLN